LIFAGFSILPKNLEKNAEMDFEAQFRTRYFSDLEIQEWRDAVGCPPICEFLLTGVLDRPAIGVWAKKLIQQPEEKERRIKRLLSDFREMEDGEFSQKIAQVLADVEAGEVPQLTRYPALFSTFEFCAANGLIRESRKEILEIFVRGARKAQEEGRIEGSITLKHEINHNGIARSVEGQLLSKHLLEVNEAALRLADNKRVSVLAARMNEEPMRFIESITHDGQSGFLYTSVFQHVDATAFATWVLHLPNSLKASVLGAMRARYQREACHPSYQDELPALRRIRDLVNGSIESPTGGGAKPISLYLNNEIVDVLDEAVDCLEDLPPKVAP
jgi:hypothetical protein